MQLVIIKDFDALIVNKTFFEQPIKNKKNKHMKNSLKGQQTITIQQEAFYRCKETQAFLNKLILLKKLKKMIVQRVFIAGKQQKIIQTFL